MDIFTWMFLGFITVVAVAIVVLVLGLMAIGLYWASEIARYRVEGD